MSRHRPDLVVRREVIESVPRPPGGRFGEHALMRPLGVPSALSRCLGVFCLNTPERVLGLTYDDGPHPVHTPRILDVLAARGATATFFVLGRQVEAHPQIARRIIQEGHEVALHGEDHRSLLTMTRREVTSYLRDAKAKVESVLSVPVSLYRPPYGAHTLAQARLVRRLGMELVLWSGDAVDWLHDEEHRIVQRALATVFPGSILLLHDDRGDPENVPSDAEFPRFDRALVLSRLLASVEARGYRTATIGQLCARHQVVRSLARERMSRS